MTTSQLSTVKQKFDFVTKRNNEWKLVTSKFTTQAHLFQLLESAENRLGVKWFPIGSETIYIAPLTPQQIELVNTLE
jgi:hypothetical protein